MLAILEDRQKPLGALRQIVLQVLAVLLADAEHDDRHLELLEHIRLGVGRKPLAQQIGAGEDADVEIRIELVEADAVLGAIVEMPERHMLGVG
ncbi:hypothetical protein D3C72_2026870 [compost metagenome]